MDRRRFMQYGTIMAGSVILNPLDSRSFGQEQNADTLIWYHQPLRILQTVLREPDARDYDADAVVKYMQEAGCNTLVVNAGGIVDFFQNPLPLANINRFMGNRDVLGEITTACHGAGFRVTGRIDFRGVEEHIYKQHPDWFSVDADGKPLQLDYTRPHLYASCYTGYHRNEHAVEFIKYLLFHYDMDGIWHNSIGVGGICYCDRCRESYRTMTGRELPVMGKAPDAELSAYMEWKSGAAARHMEKMRGTVKSFGDDKVYTAEVFSMFEAGGLINSGIDLYNARDNFDFLVSVAFLTQNSEHIHYEDLNYAGTIIRFLKSMAPDKEAIILYGGNGTAHRYVMDPPVDLKVWLWEALAVGGRFWNCNFTGMHPNATYDRRNAFNNADAYNFVKDHADLLQQQSPLSSVGIYYSRATRLFFRGKEDEEDRFDASIKGIENVLMENHIPYDFIADDQADAERLARYRLLLLPNVKCLSDNEINLIREYVSRGGHLIATFETGLYFPDGSPRPDFALGDLFGCRYTGEKVDTRKDHYQYIVAKNHPLVKPDSDRTELYINAGYTLLCNVRPGAVMVCAYEPVVHNQPPEKAWTTEWRAELPTVMQNKYGKGHVIYFCNQPDQISYNMGHPDMRNLLARSVRTLAGDAIPVTTNAPASVHLGLTQSIVKKGQYILSLVNTTSGPERPIRELVPVSGLRVTLDLGGPMKSHTILRSQGQSLVRQVDNKIVITVERLEDYYSVCLET